MPYRVRESYIEENKGPVIVDRKGRMTNERIPSYALEHLFKLTNQFFPKQYSRYDMSYQPVEITSDTDGSKFIVYRGDIYHCTDKFRGWLSDEEYVNRGGGQCPKCGSEEITGYDVDIEGKYATQKTSCDSCGEAWYNVYQLVGYSNVE